MTIQDKRDELRQRVEASRGRFTPDEPDKALPMLADKFENTAKRYPLALLGGALLIGMVLGYSGRRGKKRSGRRAGASQKISGALIDLLFAIGIGILQDISKSGLFNEDDADQKRASSAKGKNRLIRNAADLAAEAGEKMRKSGKTE